MVGCENKNKVKCGFEVGCNTGGIMRDEGGDTRTRTRTMWSNTSTTQEDSSTTTTTTTTTTSNYNNSTASSWLQLGLPINNLPTTPATPVTPPSPSFHFKLLHPPPTTTPLSSLWFTLHPSLPLSIHPSLPHLSKSFLRIKDQRLRVRLVMKYVAHKLGLDCESQVEIRCRGQILEPFLTLQHVRDRIWSPTHALTLLPNSSTSPHLMLLHYAIPSPSSTHLPSP